MLRKHNNTMDQRSRHLLDTAVAVREVARNRHNQFLGAAIRRASRLMIRTTDSGVLPDPWSASGYAINCSLLVHIRSRSLRHVPQLS